MAKNRYSDFLSQISADTDNQSDILHLSYTCLIWFLMK